MHSSPVRVAVLVYDRCFAGEAFGFTDLLTIANQVSTSHRKPFVVSAITAREEPITASGGIVINPASVREPVHLLVVPGFDLHPDDDLDQRLAALKPEVDYIRSMPSHRTKIASICVGTFLVGEAGLLDDTSCTTAWLFADALAQRFPRSIVERDELIVEHPDLTTAGAFSAAHDLALRLINATLGREVGRTVSRITLTADQRDRQTAYIDQRLIASVAPPFSQNVKNRLVEDLTEAYDLTKLARAFHVSSRTLLRRFHAETGQSPLTFLQETRLSEAKRLLVSSPANVTEVMHQVGYQDPTTFRRLFVKHLGMTPSEYRNRFATADNPTLSEPADGGRMHNTPPSVVATRSGRATDPAT